MSAGTGQHSGLLEAVLQGRVHHKLLYWQVKYHIALHDKQWFYLVDYVCIVEFACLRQVQI